MSNAIEITSVKKVDDKPWMATCDAYVKMLDFDFNEIKVFQKGDRIWVSMPSRSFQTKEGEYKYQDFGTFRNADRQKKFKEQVANEFSKYYRQYPDFDGPLSPKGVDDQECRF